MTPTTTDKDEPCIELDDTEYEAIDGDDDEEETYNKKATLSTDMSRNLKQIELFMRQLNHTLDRKLKKREYFGDLELEISELNKRFSNAKDLIAYYQANQTSDKDQTMLVEYLTVKRVNDLNDSFSLANKLTLVLSSHSNGFYSPFLFLNEYDSFQRYEDSLFRRVASMSKSEPDYRLIIQNNLKLTQSDDTFQLSVYQFEDKVRLVPVPACDLVCNTGNFVKIKSKTSVLSGKKARATTEKQSNYSGFNII